jgi:hypothetical protein
LASELRSTIGIADNLINIGGRLAKQSVVDKQTAQSEHVAN